MEIKDIGAEKRSVVTETSLKDEIYRVTHYWPYSVIAFLVGSLIGWGLSFLIPPVHQASIVFSLAYDDVLACRNPDDCKNWQLEQMDAFTKSEPVLNQTLDSLRSKDEYWEEIEVGQFEEMLDVNWQNAGRWQFMVESNNAERSKQAVEVWSDVFLNQVQIAQGYAKHLIDLNGRIYAINQSQVHLDQQLLVLDLVQNELKEFRNDFNSMSEKEPIENLSRWELYAVAAHAAGNDVAWQKLLESFPDEGAPLSAYLPWVDRVEVSVDQEIKDLSSQLDQLNKELSNTLDQIEIEAKNSHSISQTLTFSRMPGEQAQLTIFRRSTTTAVLGGIVGLLVWGIFWIGLPLKRKRD